MAKKLSSKRTTRTNSDPHPYHGPIERIDGERPYNNYLWPTESWWATKDLGRQFDSRWHFGIVSLADGRFSVAGSVYCIERNDDDGKPCVYATRAEAIRTAAARMIKVARYSKNWMSYYTCGGLKGRMLAEVINWARNIVAKETGRPQPKQVVVPDYSPPYRKTGLPLLDFCQAQQSRE